MGNKQFGGEQGFVDLEANQQSNDSLGASQRPEQHQDLVTISFEEPGKNLTL